MQKQQTKHAFIVSGFSRNSHTFIRSDFASLDASDWTLIEIDELSARTANWSCRLRFGLQALVLMVRLHFRVLPMLFSRRGLTAAHGLFVAVQLLATQGAQPASIRCHFLGTASVASWAISVLHGIPFTVVLHGSDLYSSPRAFDRLLRGAQRIECVTSFGKGFVFGRLGSAAIGRAVTCRNRLLKDALIFKKPLPSRAPGSTKARLRLVGVGRIVRQKDFAFALEVIEAIARGTRFDIVYDLVGDGPLRDDLEALAARLRITEKVNFLGQMEHGEVLNTLSGADGFLLPCEERSMQNADGLPVVLQEALALGVPVFCRQAFGVGELVINGVNGHAFEVEASPERWAEQIVRMAADFDPNLVAATITVHDDGMAHGKGHYLSLSDTNAQGM